MQRKRTSEPRPLFDFGRWWLPLPRRSRQHAEDTPPAPIRANTGGRHRLTRGGVA